MNDEELKKEYEKLTEKQKRFIDYYVETANATESARLAGYSEKTADRIGHENLRKLEIFIKFKMEQIESDRIATQKEVLEYLTRVMRGKEKDQFGLYATLQDRTKCSDLLGKRYWTFVEKKELSGGYKVELVDDVNE